MHFVFGTRGIQHAVDLWHTQMQGVYLPWERKNLDTGEIQKTNIQVALRPIQLWELVFPQEHLNTILNSLDVKPKGLTEPPALNKYAWLLRKGMGLKPIPAEIPPSPVFPVFHNNIHFFPIGIKDDIVEDCDFGKEGRWHQERL